jgi:hypothetical protein
MVEEICFENDEPIHALRLSLKQLLWYQIIIVYLLAIFVEGT